MSRAMSKLIVEMEMPKVCITKDGYYGNCPMDRVWCIQGNAPSEITIGEAYAEMTENIPSWCPIKGVLPDVHGDLIDRDKLKRAFCNHCDGRDTMNGEPNCTEPCFDLGLMDCMPVIIAAERRDDEQIH